MSTDIWDACNRRPEDNSEIKKRIAMTKKAFNKKKRLFFSNIDLVLEKIMILIIRYVWDGYPITNVMRLLNGHKIWTLGKRKKDKIKVFEMWVWRGLDAVCNEEGSLIIMLMDIIMLIHLDIVYIIFINWQNPAWAISQNRNRLQKTICFKVIFL